MKKEWFKNPICMALAINLVFLVLYIIFSPCNLSSLDDVVMSSFVTGAYGGEFDPHLYFVNAIYAYFLKPFYQVFPTIGWYYIFEVVAVFVSFTSLCYALIKKAENKWGLLLSALLLSGSSYDFYYRVGFTQTAALLTSAGLVLIFMVPERRKLPLYTGLLLLVGGFVFRKEAFLLGTPFGLTMLVVNYLRSKTIPWASLFAGVLAFGVIAGLLVGDKSLYTDKEYSYYAAYQGPRAVFGDGAYYDGEAAYDELEDGGRNGADLHMLQNWMFYDTEVFSLDSLKPFLNVVQRNKYSLNYAKFPIALWYIFQKSFAGGVPWCYVFFSCILLFGCRGKLRYYPWVPFLWVVVCLAYLLIVNRVVAHVVVGIWIYACVSLIPFVRREYLAINLTRRLTLASLFVIALFYVFCCWGHIESDERNDDAMISFYNYASSHKDDVYILPFNPYKEFVNHFRRQSYLAVSPGSWNNIFSLGYWNIYFPPMEREMEKRGVTNPLRNIVKENVYVFDERRRGEWEFFYERHYHQKLIVDSLLQLGKYKLYKYNLAEEE